MKYIKVDDFERIAQEAMRAAENGFICLDNITNQLKQLKPVHVANIQYLPDAVRAMEKVEANPKRNEYLISRITNKSELSEAMEGAGHRVTRQTVAQWQKQAQALGYRAKKPIHYNNHDVNISELLRFLQRIEKDKGG